MDQMKVILWTEPAMDSYTDVPSMPIFPNLEYMH